jgi:hypothetical protein
LARAWPSCPYSSPSAAAQSCAPVASKRCGCQQGSSVKKKSHVAFQSPALTYCSDPSNRRIKLQINTTTAVVLATFILRAAFTCLNSYGLYFAISEQHSEGSSCTNPCGACHSPPYLINRFLFFFPELRAAVVLLSSPLALLVACWGMTSQGKRLRSTPATAVHTFSHPSASASWAILKQGSAPGISTQPLIDSAADQQG